MVHVALRLRPQHPRPLQRTPAAQARRPEADKLIGAYESKRERAIEKARSRAANRTHGRSTRNRCNYRAREHQPAWPLLRLVLTPQDKRRPIALLPRPKWASGDEPKSGFDADSASHHGRTLQHQRLSQPSTTAAAPFAEALATAAQPLGFPQSNELDLFQTPPKPHVADDEWLDSPERAALPATPRAPAKDSNANPRSRSTRRCPHRCSLSPTRTSPSAAAPTRTSRR